MEALGSSLDGLTRVEAGRRLLYFGPNELEERKRIAPWKIFLEQFKSFLIVILLVAVALSAILGEVVESVRNRGPGL